jgi:hypothetical protein
MAYETVTWQNGVNTTPTSGANQTITKTGGLDATPDTRAESSQTITTGGGIRCKRADIGAGQSMIGLHSAGTLAYADIPFGLAFGSATASVYELGVYRTETAQAATDVFEIKQVGTSVIYYKNGVSFRETTSASAVGLRFVVLINGSGLAFTECEIDPAAGGPLSAGTQTLTLTAPTATVVGDNTVPLTYDLRTDRTIEEPGATPSLGAAGSRIIDAIFNTPQHRATDANSGVALGLTAGRSWSTNSATYQCMWNSNSTRLVVRNSNASTLVIEIDPDASESLNEPLVIGDERTLAWGIEGSWSKTDPNLMYGTRFISAHDVEVYNFTTNTYSTILDLDSIDGGLSGTYLNSLYVGGGPTPRCAVVYGGTAQGNHNKVVVFELANPANRHVINMLTNTIDGVQAKDADGVTNFTFEGETGLHSISIDNSSRYVRIDPNWNSSLGFWVFDYTLNRITKVTTNPAGHYILGWENCFNEDQGAGPKPQWQARSLDFTSIETTTPRITTSISPIQPSWGDHTSAHNQRTAADAVAPFFSDSQGWDPGGSIGWTTWTDENIAVASTGSEMVWRIGHHRMIPYGDIDPLSNPSESYQTRSNVSPCGRFIAYKTNWDKTLGYDTLYADPLLSNERYRTDVMIARMETFVATGTSVNTMTLTAPTATRIAGPKTIAATAQTGTLTAGSVSVNGSVPDSGIWTTVTGSLYDARTGLKVTTGKLFIRPNGFICNGAHIVAPKTVEYTIPGSGNISVVLAQSNGVTYTVEFDPNPADAATPRKQKPGYFMNTWTIPASGPVDLTVL